MMSKAAAKKKTSGNESPASDSADSSTRWTFLTNHIPSWQYSIQIRYSCFDKLPSRLASRSGLFSVSSRTSKRAGLFSRKKWDAATGTMCLRNNRFATLSNRTERSAIYSNLSTSRLCSLDLSGY